MKGREMKHITGTILLALALVGSTVAQEEKTDAKTAIAPSPQEPITGQCHCGHIKYEAQGPVVDSNHCNCRGCQRATGSLRSAILVVPRAGFKIVSGKISSFRAKDGVKCDKHGIWYFCPKCGSQVYWKPDRGQVFDIFAGTLDDLTIFKPKKK